MSNDRSVYREAGVDIDAKYEAVRSSLQAIRSTFTAGVVGDIGQFGGVFDVAAVGAAGQHLVASIDGVGTKVEIARRAGRLGSVGADLVNHCINDVLVQGARPLFFLDYIAVARMVPKDVRDVITGIATACRESGCALIGGETAEMPGVYRDGAFDVAGVIVGAVAKDKLLDGSRVAVGDKILALPSTGLHTNGYSLARAVVDKMRWPLDARPKELGGATLADALLAVHRSYYRDLWPLLERDLIHGLAHITGGGLYDNLPRILPERTAASIDAAAMPRPPIFDLLVTAGDVAREEAYRVLNMGFGMLVVVAADRCSAVQADLAARGVDAFDVGMITRGNRVVTIT